MKKTYDSTQSPNESNSYKPLNTIEREDSVKEAFIEEEMSTSLDDTLLTDNRTSSSTTVIKHYNEDHSVKNTSLEIIEKMILEFSTSDKSELREINRISTNVTAKLNHYYQNNLEYRNYRIMQWVSQLETINDDYYQCIGEL